MGLGPLTTLSLAQARTRAGEARLVLVDGLDPIEQRRLTRAQALIDAAGVVTFKRAAERYIQAHEATWHNAKHRAQWASTLRDYVYPVIGPLPVSAIDVGLVLQCIEPIWTSKPETAGRVRGRIEAVLDWAGARGYRPKENPARWQGNLSMLLPSRSRMGRIVHHPAMPYADIPAFMPTLRASGEVAAKCLEFVILTAARTSEATGARWSEFDLEQKVWTVPAERMKARREHRVPLSSRALEILEKMPRTGDFVFSGRREKRPLSNMALLMFLRRNGHTDITVHGFRSSFRDWAAESTGFANEVAEMALAHVISNGVEAAYRRGDLFAKRRQLMTAWARHCETAPTTGANVTPIQRARGAR
jgi:integrase